MPCQITWLILILKLIELPSRGEQRGGGVRIKARGAPLFIAAVSAALVIFAGSVFASSGSTEGETNYNGPPRTTTSKTFTGGTNMPHWMVKQASKLKPSKQPVRSNLPRNLRRDR